MNLKKWLAMALCAVLLMQSVPAADAAFSDVGDAESALAVSTLAGLGVVSYADSYRPNDSLTRAEACKLLVCAMGLSASVSTSAKKTLFADVKSSKWYNGYVNLAYAQGIINGLGNGTFGPNDPLTYGQLATMLLRLLGYTSADTGSAWPLDQINYCEGLGISDDLGFHGEGRLTRAQAAVMIYRALKTDKKGTGKPYYAAMNGVASSASAILVSVNASTGGTDGLVSACLLDGGSGVTYYTQANQQSDALAGRAGTLLFDAAGRVTGFIPNGTAYLDVKLSSAAASAVTASDGVTRRVASGAKVIIGGEVYSYATSGYVQLNNRTGKAVRLFYDDNGAITYLYLAEGMLGDGAAAVAETTSAAASLARQLGVTSASYAITKNGAAAAASDLARDDVGYYDALSNTLRVSDYIVSGYISAASPNITAAETVTVAGHTFDVLECAWDTLGEYKLGAKVTLLLTDDGKVAAARAASADDTMLGVLAANGKSVTLLGSGITLSAGTMSCQTSELGSLVTVKASAADEFSCTAVKETVTQKLDLSARTLGTTPLAPACAVLEWGGSGYVYSLEGVQGEASEDFDAIGWTTALPASHVSYAHTNTAGEVDVLLLKNVTGNYFTYGKLTLYKGEDGINLGSGSMAAYNTAGVLHNSGGASSKYLCALSASSGSYVGITLSNGTGSYKSVSSIRTLSKLSVSQSAFFTQNDTWYAVSGGVEYPVSDSVEILIGGTDTWEKGTDTLLTLLSGDYGFTAYYDAAPSDGGQIRIIVVS